MKGNIGQRREKKIHLRLVGQSRKSRRERQKKREVARQGQRTREAPACAQRGRQQGRGRGGRSAKGPLPAGFGAAAKSRARCAPRPLLPPLSPTLPPLRLAPSSIFSPQLFPWRVLEAAASQLAGGGGRETPQRCGNGGDMERCCAQDCGCLRGLRLEQD
ncbi:hypothetical protein R5R35_012992 [Gryllus longicercus]|uniref:Uncharacterized protein n=1 Tax=Gryllus longicercus TaxID=2509291 RepID=A0AAN9V9F4_9ORTH